MAYKEDKIKAKDDILLAIEAAKPKKEVRDQIDLLVIEWQELLNHYDSLTADDCINRYRDAEATVGLYTDLFMAFLIANDLLKDEYTTKDIERIKNGFKEVEGLG